MNAKYLKRLMEYDDIIINGRSFIICHIIYNICQKNIYLIFLKMIHIQRFMVISRLRILSVQEMQMERMIFIS